MPVVTSVSASGAQPTTTPRQRKIPRLRSRWSVARTGMPTHSGNMPYKLPQSWSCRCSHSTFSACRSGFSRNAAAEIRSWAMACRRLSPCCFAHSTARILFTWYLTAFVGRMASASRTLAASGSSLSPESVGTFGALQPIGCLRVRWANKMNYFNFASTWSSVPTSSSVLHVQKASLSPMTTAPFWERLATKWTPSR